MSIKGIIWTVIVTICVIYMSFCTLDWIISYITHGVKLNLEKRDSSLFSVLGEMKVYNRINFFILILWWICFYKGFIE